MKDFKKIVITKEQWEKALIEIEKLYEKKPLERSIDCYFIDLKNDGSLYASPDVGTIYEAGIGVYFFDIKTLKNKINNYNEDDNTYYSFVDRFMQENFMKKDRFLRYIERLKEDAREARETIEYTDSLDLDELTEENI